MSGDPNILLSDYVEATAAAQPSPVQNMNSTNGEPRPLFNARDPQYVLQSERPVHRAIIFLAAQGLSYIEIAQQLGITPSCVQYVVKQDWAQEEILKQIHENGGNAVAQVLSQQALPSVMKLIELRDSEKSAAEVQRKSANDLLDRIFGKAAQPIIHQQADLETLSDEELAKIAAPGQRN